jgi:hypothetical protein
MEVEPMPVFGFAANSFSHASVAGLVRVLLASVSCAVLVHFLVKHFIKGFKSNKISSTGSSTKKKRGPVCPFSAETDFLVETAEHMPPAPLDLFESWINPEDKDFGKPLAARWLNAGLSGQDTPGMLRAGLKRLRNSKFFLVVEPFRIQEELFMKKKALDDPKRYPKHFVAEKDSVDAQQESLELVLSDLPKRYPELYKYDKQAKTIYVAPIDTTFHLDDWKDRPLELCVRIVQEDLVLMRPPRESDGSTQYAMAAAAVVFSFSELPQKLGKPVEFIHAPVPGYEKYLRKALDLTFSKLLKVEQPMWRNNWGIDPTGKLDEPLYGSTEAHSHRKFSKATIDDIKAKFLKVEYQTIRRLPNTDYLLFTVKTMVDPMSALEDVPKAASCLASSIRGMSPAMRGYKGIQDDDTCNVVLKYLDSISA